MQSLQLLLNHRSASSHLEQWVAMVAVAGEAAITTPGSAGLGAAWWHHSLRIAGTYPAVLFCRSSPIWLQELPADLDTFVNIAFFFRLFFFNPDMLYNYNVYLFLPSLLPLQIMQAV